MSTPSVTYVGKPHTLHITPPAHRNGDSAGHGNCAECGTYCERHWWTAYLGGPLQPLCEPCAS